MKILVSQIRDIVNSVLSATDRLHWDSAYTHSLITGDATVHHTHANKTLLDSYSNSNTDITGTIADRHTHANKAILDAYDQPNSAISTAVAQTHTHANKALIDTYTQTEVNLADAVTNKHSHVNKTILDTYDQTNANITDAVVKKHAHANQALLDTYTPSNSDLLDAIALAHVHANYGLLETYTATNVNILNAITLAHTHNNLSLLQSIISSGDGHSFLANDGTYKAVAADAAGSDTQVMFNDTGTLAGDTTFTFNTVNNLLTVSSILSSDKTYIANATTYISKNVGNDLVFTDANSGSVTLATLLSSSTNPWTVGSGYIKYGTGSSKVGINTIAAPIEALEIVGNITATDFSSQYFRYKNSNLLLGPTSGDNELGNNKLYIANSNTASPLIYGEFDSGIVRFNADVYINGTGSLNIGSGTSKVYSFGGDNLTFQDGVANSGNLIYLRQLIDGTYNTRVADFVDLPAVQSITSANKAIWNKASVLINNSAGDAYLTNDGTYKIMGSGGNSSILYLHTEDSDVATYKKLLTTPANDPEATTAVAVTSGTSPVLIKSHVTEPTYPGITSIPAGLWVFNTYLSVSSATGTTDVTIRVYKRTSGGTETELFNVATPEINSLTALDYPIEVIQPAFTINATDRIVIKYYTSTTSVGGVTVTKYFEGTLHYSHIHIPVTSGALTAVDDIFDWNSTYYRPYPTKTDAGGVASAGRMYNGTDTPTATNRLNYDGYLYATKLFSNGVEVASHAAVTTTDTSTIDFTLTGQAITASVIQGGLSLNSLGEKDFSSLTGKPTTLAGYGITDAASLTHTHTFASLTSKPTTLAGYGITDALGISSNAVSASKLLTARAIALSGDATGTANFDGTAGISIATTLATVATAGTYKSVTVNAKGLVTAGTNPTTLAGYGITDAASSTHTHVFSTITSTPTTLSGYGITDAQPLSTAWNTGNFAPSNYLSKVANDYTTSKIGVNLIYGAATPTISLAIGDSDTGFNAQIDGVTFYCSNGIPKYSMNNVYHAANINLDTIDLTGKEIYANNWFRSVTTGTGWYSEPNATGIFSDTVGQVKVYNNGSFLVNNTITGNNLISTGGSNLGMYTSVGQVPTFPSSANPVLKTDTSHIYFSTGGFFTGHLSTGGLAINDSTNTAKIYFGTGSSSYILGGNVGIGTPGPGHKLEVNGNMNLYSGFKYKINGVNLSYSDVGAQAAASTLTTLSLVSPSANTIPYFTGTSTASSTVLTPFARTLIDDTTASAAQTTLGLGSIATHNFWTGTQAAYDAIGTKDSNTIYFIAV